MSNRISSLSDRMNAAPQSTSHTQQRTTTSSVHPSGRFRTYRNAICRRKETNMIAISATITFSARSLSHEPAIDELGGFVGFIGDIDSAQTHLADESWPARQPLRTMAGDAGHSTG